MRKASIFLLFTVLTALPALAVERHQSYISYDDGGTTVRSGDDGREIDAHRNLPIYPGDEVETGRRGRSEIRLSDGNIVGLDRSTAVRFESILDSYEGDADETVAQLRFGKIAVQRTDLGHDHVRIDTDNASYVAEYEAIYSVETDAHGRDRVVVFDGTLEVRTRQRATRLRRGESATIDDRGVYDLASGQNEAADDFERWFLRRADRFENYNNRYVDRRLGYWGDDLDEHGKWVFVTGIGWSWRPIVSVGWRPYYNGYWYRGGNGCLTWVSYDPWGWAPYHYGRWAYDPGYGWIWVPGYGYSPAWVYWWYGSGYVGWAPAGWWDCHRGYYDWAYRPYRNADFGFGFQGRIRVGEMDLRPWTFVDSTGLISNRVDRAALTTDAVKHRLGRSSGGYDTISATPARLVGDKLRDPAESIRRAGLGGDDSAATAPDMTAYFRRDANLSGGVRDRIVRSRGSAPSSPNTPASGTTASTPDHRGGVGGGRINRGGGGVAPVTGGSPAPIGSGSVAPIRGGSPAPITGGSPAPITGGSDRRGEGGSITRGSTPAPSEPDSGRGSRGGITRGRDNDSGEDSGTRGSSGWRDRTNRPAETPQVTPPPSNATTPPPADDNNSRRGSRNDSWRSKVRGGETPDVDTSNRTPSSERRSNDGASSGSSSDVPRRVIDRIGGARIYPRSEEGSSSRGSGSSTRRGDSDRGSSGSRETVRPSRPSSDSGSSSRSSGSSNSGSSSSGRSSGDSGSRSGGGSSGGNRGEGGSIKKD
ncbi:MAG TPA: DUF6600 domain-containing protein [Thermoanaerobaculia bacterium]|nr:DUF6600 domain-containing protein [Thermoanaerobaculia bacterium]